MPKKDQKVYVRNSKIMIFRDSFTREAVTTYDKNLLKKIESVTWTVKRSKTGKEYLYCNKYGTLHKLVASHFYGDDIIKKAYENDFVIDHLDNDGYDCTFNNLVIISRYENSAKGLTYDIKRKESSNIFSINITRDFSTKEFQIAIVFNKHGTLIEDNNLVPLGSIHFRYGEDFYTAFYDAQFIINTLNNNMELDIKLLRCQEVCICNLVRDEYVTKEEYDSGFCVRDGEQYFIQNNPNVIILKTNHNEDLHKR